MSTVNNKLTNLADEIRELSGVTEPLGLDEMATNVNDANDEVAAQATTISEIMELLEGKSISGGGEDVTAEVTAQTTLIDDLEAAVDALPDAKSCGGGVETCTITLAALAPPPPAANDIIFYTDATQTPQRVVHQFGVPYEVVKGSIVVFDGGSFSYPTLSLPTGMELVTPKAYFVTGDVTLTIS